MNEQYVIRFVWASARVVAAAGTRGVIIDQEEEPPAITTKAPSFLARLVPTHNRRPPQKPFPFPFISLYPTRPVATLFFPALPLARDIP